MTQDSIRTHKKAADESRMTIDLSLTNVVVDVEEGKKVEKDEEIMDEDAEFTSFEAVCVKLLSDDDGIPSASETVYLKKNVTIIYEYHENVKGPLHTPKYPQSQAVSQHQLIPTACVFYSQGQSGSKLQWIDLFEDHRHQKVGHCDLSNREGQKKDHREPPGW